MRDGHAAREHLALAAHRGRGVDEEVVDAPLLVGALLAGEVEDLVVDHAPRELEVVPGELGEHHAVDRAARAEARVAVRRRWCRRRGGSASRARSGGSRARSSRCRSPRATRARRADRPARARRRRRLRAEHAEEAQGVEVERVGQREHVQPRALERVERAGLEVARHAAKSAGAGGRGRRTARVDRERRRGTAAPPACAPRPSRGGARARRRRGRRPS